MLVLVSFHNSNNRKFRQWYRRGRTKLYLPANHFLETWFDFPRVLDIEIHCIPQGKISIKHFYVNKIEIFHIKTMRLFFLSTITTFPLQLSAVNPKSELCCCRKTIYPVIMSHQAQLVGNFYAIISRTASCLIVDVNGIQPGTVWKRLKNYKLMYCFLYLSILSWLGRDVESRHSRNERC